LRQSRQIIVVSEHWFECRLKDAGWVAKACERLQIRLLAAPPVALAAGRKR